MDGLMLAVFMMAAFSVLLHHKAFRKDEGYRVKRKMWKTETSEAINKVFAQIAKEENLETSGIHAKPTTAAFTTDPLVMWHETPLDQIKNMFLITLLTEAALWKVGERPDKRKVFNFSSDFPYHEDIAVKMKTKSIVYEKPPEDKNKIYKYEELVGGSQRDKLDIMIRNFAQRMARRYKIDPDDLVEYLYKILPAADRVVRTMFGDEKLAEKMLEHMTRVEDPVQAVRNVNPEVLDAIREFYRAIKIHTGMVKPEENRPSVDSPALLERVERLEKEVESLRNRVDELTSLVLRLLSKEG